MALGKKQTRLQPAPVTYPTGGGLAQMAASKNKIKEHEINVAKAKHDLEMAKIHQKHSQKATSATKTSKRP